MANNKMFFVLTGDPGVGKTTLAKKLISLLSTKGVNTYGFYTEEVRKNGVREGFDIVSLQGSRARLARDQSFLTGPVKDKVGKYGVLVKEFEEVALTCLEKPSCSGPQVLVIDEIGKMELFSGPFKAQVKKIFSQPSNVCLVTIPIRKGDPIIENIRNDKRSKVWVITKENRNYMLEEVFNEISAIFN